jgi:hypothetical protein
MTTISAKGSWSKKRFDRLETGHSEPWAGALTAAFRSYRASLFTKASSAQIEAVITRLQKVARVAFQQTLPYALSCQQNRMRA